MEKVFYLKTITFNTNGGSKVPEQKLLMGETVARPADPNKEGSIFAGWFTDNNTFKQEWVFGTVPEKSITLYAKWEGGNVVEPEPNGNLILVLDTTELDSRDSVSFSDTDSNQMNVLNGAAVSINYTLADTADATSILRLFVMSDIIFSADASGSGVHNYIADESHAINGIVTIRAVSIHTNLIVLDEPKDVTFNSEGEIFFTPGANNAAAGAVYKLTLYRGSSEVPNCKDIPVTSGSTFTELKTEMLKEAGAYNIRVWAETLNSAYLSPSIDISSNSVIHVYDVNVTISGITSSESLSNGIDNYNTDGIHTFCVFGGTTVTLTANPGTYRIITWSGAGTGTDNIRSVTITGNTSVSITFETAPVTVTTGSTSKNYINLAQAFASITAAGNYIVLIDSHSSPNAYSYFTGTAVRTVTLEPRSGPAEVQLIGTGSLVNVVNGVSVIMEDGITLIGVANNSASLVQVQTGGTFAMKGGEINGNTNSMIGGGVTVNGGTFTMNGGIIRGNTAMNIGGVVVSSGSFTMTGGSITGNFGTQIPGDVYIYNTAVNSFNLSGNAEIGDLLLFASNTANTSITIGNTSNITIGNLFLYGSEKIINTIINNWNNKVILNPAASYAITATDIAKFNNMPGYFLAFDSGLIQQPISNTHTIGTSGTDLGKLIGIPGTFYNPFLVADENDLIRVGSGQTYGGGVWSLSAYYKQTAAINLTSNWTPIGSSATPFSGVYDGDRKSIIDLSINTTSSREGMFSVISADGIVKNIDMINVNVSCNNNEYIGVIAGENLGTIINCYVQGNVSSAPAASSQIIGGIAGKNSGTIKNCNSIVNVSGFGGIGGIAGNNDGSSAIIINCFSGGVIEVAGSDAGGIAGVNQNDAGIYFCYSTSEVKGSGILGGIVGANKTRASVTYNIALNKSVMSASNTVYVGRIAGQNTNPGTLNSNRAWTYISVSTAGTYTPAETTNGKDGLSATVAALKSQAVWQTDANFSFGAGDDSPWVWDASGTTMPRLYWQTSGIAWPVDKVQTGITITLNQITDPAQEINLGTNIVLYHIPSAGPSTATINLPAGHGGTLIEWYVDGITTPIHTGNTPLVLNVTDNRYNAVKTHSLTLEITISGVVYSKVVKFEVRYDQ